jgi:hypothetical protein
VQRLLGDADWGEEALRDDLRTYVNEHLADEAPVVAALPVDSSGAGQTRSYGATSRTTASGFSSAAVCTAGEGAGTDQR